MWADVVRAMKKQIAVRETVCTGQQLP